MFFMKIEKLYLLLFTGKLAGKSIKYAVIKSFLYMWDGL